MERIIAFLASDMTFLWRGARFRITGSSVSTSNGGDGLLLLESDVLRLQISCDRQQLALELQPVGSDPGKGEWFTLSLFRRLVTGQPQTSALLDASYARFLEQNLDAIEQRVDQDWEATCAELEQLALLRSRELTVGGRVGRTTRRRNGG